MNKENFSIESQPMPHDVSEEFLKMEAFDFLDFLRTLKKEPVLSITVDWPGVADARRLKAFLETGKPVGQKRTVTIRATESQKDEEPNVFASDVKWEKVEE